MHPLFPALLLATAAPTTAPPVQPIDDQAHIQSFTEHLPAHRQHPRALTCARASRLLQSNEGRHLPLPPPPPPIPQSTTLYRHCSPAIVAIGSIYQCDECGQWHESGFATGWIASPDGHIVTNHHVLDIDNDELLGVITSDGSVFPVIDIPAAHRASDTAILLIDTLGRQLPHLTLAPSIAPGDPVTVISHPKGRFYSLTHGTVSRIHRETDADGTATTWLNITADYAAGSSGAPVLDSQGRVAGMVSSTLTAYAEDQCPHEPLPDVQMIFKDCSSLEALKNLLREKK